MELEKGEEKKDSMGKMKLRVKLAGGFLILAGVTLIVGLAGWNGVSSSQTAMEKVSYTENMARNLLQKEIDHLNWAQKVGEFQRTESLTELGVEKDEHKCGFGRCGEESGHAGGGGGQEHGQFDRGNGEKGQKRVGDRNSDERSLWQGGPGGQEGRRSDG
jgi:hypothetical protein